MNDKYADNKIRWPVGSLVIHRADAKKPEMLMKVEGYATRDNSLCLTRYAEKNIMNGGKTDVWVNDIAHLLDPLNFMDPLPPRKPISETV